MNCQRDRVIECSPRRLRAVAHQWRLIRASFVTVGGAQDAVHVHVDAHVLTDEHLTEPLLAGLLMLQMVVHDDPTRTQLGLPLHLSPLASPFVTVRRALHSMSLDWSTSIFFGILLAT